jgi:hypothetical protein
MGLRSSTSETPSRRQFRFANLGGEFFGKGPGNRRKIHAGLFKDPAFSMTRVRPPPALSGPEVFSKLRSVQFFKAAADPILKASEELFCPFTP